MSINDKIKQVLTIKNLSPSYLADDIGVQRSSISHILSGRNRPSLDIIQKIVRRYPEFSYEWFLEEDEQLPLHSKNTGSETTADWPADQSLKTNSPPVRRQNLPLKPQIQVNNASDKDTNGTVIPKQIISAKPFVERILIFYSDGTFREYSPAATPTL